MFFLANSYSTGTQHGNLSLAGWPILFCGPTQEPCISHSQDRKNLERSGKNSGEWTGKVELGKEEIPGSKRSILKGERLSSVLSPDRTSISASTAPYCREHMKTHKALLMTSWHLLGMETTRQCWKAWGTDSTTAGSPGTAELHAWAGSTTAQSIVSGSPRPVS